MKSILVKTSAVCLAAAVLMTGCGSKTASAEAVDLRTLSLDEIEAKAKEEGKISSVGMPEGWAN